MMPQITRPFWPDRSQIWRWHFFAGLFCLPFVIMLCFTGTLYLFKSQVERALDRPIQTHVTSGPAHPASEQIRTALAAIPHGTFLAWEMQPPHTATQILIRHGEDVTRVYLDPATCRILATRDEATRFMRLVFRLHGQLLIGNIGSVIMELVASWTFVLVVTGIYLWWPRQGARIGGTALPRLHQAGRTRWRDIHAVGGVWISVVLVVFLASGLPWSYVWGHALSAIESRIGMSSPVRDWAIGAVPIATTVAGTDAMPGMDMPGMDMQDTQRPNRPVADTPGRGPSLATPEPNAVLSTVQHLNWPAPVLVTPPTIPGQPWSARSDAQNRTRRAEAKILPSGQIVHMTRFADKPLSDRLIGVGVAFHEGHLFGIANLILNAIVATLLCLASVAALVLWLRRRAPGHLDAPRSCPGQPVGWFALGGMLLLALLLPELAVSLVLIALAERLLKNRVSAFGKKT